MNATVSARCEKVTVEAGDVKVFTLRAVDADKTFSASLQAGAHLPVWFMDDAGKAARRVYTIIDSTPSASVDIAVKRGHPHSVSDNLHRQLKEGDLLPIEPAQPGISVSSLRGYQRVAMVAGGIGVTLPLALLRELASRPVQGKGSPRVTLLLCVPHVRDIPFLHELLALSLSAPWFQLQIHVTQDDITSCGPFRAGRPSAETLGAMGEHQLAILCGSHAFASGLSARLGDIAPAMMQMIEAYSPPAYAEPESHSPSEAPPARVLIAGSDTPLKATQGQSLLAILESQGVDVRSQCRSGICGSCRLKVSGGSCHFEQDFCLTEQQRHQGFALACCTFPLAGDVIVQLPSPV